MNIAKTIVRWWQEVDLKKQVNETNNQFIWRLASAKDNGELDYSWQQLADIFNAECGGDKQTESSYRKAYQYAKKFYDDVFCNFEDSDEINRINAAKEELFKERVKLTDERTSLNAKLRQQARHERSIDLLEDAIHNVCTNKYEAICVDQSTRSGKDVICCLADIHYGMAFDNFVGKYDPDIANRRLNDYAKKVITIGKENSADNCYVTILGDCISGNIHKSIQVQNRENVVNQIMQCSEALSRFVYSLTMYYKNVYVNSVVGNHTRIDKKDDAIKDERLDSIITWYIQSSLSHLKNVYVTVKNDLDATVASFEVKGKKYVSVHGDYDDMSEKSVYKLCQWLGYNPDYIFYGHYHHPEMTYFGDICAMRCGCLSGSGDDYTIEKRLHGHAYQTVCVCDETGIVNFYPVRLV